ncbi:aspartate transaminase [Agrilactobacillus composti DSM 18527 = JCM 14202]|uniref:Aminotransferase n=1 Tax=Agrilactobacillus composti DSM 18527 = JCM 14202 TaxID=1423734 RepID=A0A0R1XPP6_9LACO|nr:aminotransferase class I/II-fold pyridoxal phosphate-dependent enzyme [Agrilactobacillus composti]KRM31621.1 aspartate transaminase [Agrilactobacillus composti DSM 18527 = JCM 14202]
MTKDLSTHMKTELAQLQPSGILAFNKEISTIPDIVKLTLGEPDFNTPEHVKQAGIRSIEADHSHYTNSAGELELRQAAATFLANKYDVHYDPESEVLVTAGATEAIYSALTAILNPGDAVVIPTPIFPLYIPITILNGAKPIFIDTSATGFVLDADKLDEVLQANSNVKAVVLNYPNNPTGVTYHREALQKLAKVIAKYDIFAICDEIYSELTYGTTHVSLAEFLPDQVLLLNGVSKSHAMTGWRIGLLCGPKAVVTQIGKVHQFCITCATANAQDAALEAFKNGPDDGVKMRAAYQERRDYLVKALGDIGFTSAAPDGAFYLFAKIPAGLIQNSADFCYDLAKKAKVALIAGSNFGPGGEGYVRISYAASMADLQKAVTRIGAYVADNQVTAQ